MAKMNGRLRAVISSATGVITLPLTLTSRMAMIEFGRLHQLDRFADFAGLGSDAVAQLFQHVSDHHPDHDLVFNEENRTACRPCRYHDGNPCPSKALRFAKNTSWRNVDMNRRALRQKAVPGDGFSVP